LLVLTARVSRKGKTTRAAPPRPPETSQPELLISYSPAGHETMAAIAQELLAPSPPKPPPAASDDDGPEVSVVEGPVGRETLALIAEMARPIRAQQSTLNYGDRISNAPGAMTPSRAPSPPSSTPAAAPAPLTIFEMLTFVVQGAEIASLSSEAVRRRFVEEHLLQRLPARNMDQVERVDVTPWTVQGTVVVRVWCKV
jgi:hypothetical protein